MARRATTLIEVLICMGLLTILLSTVFFWYGRFFSRKDHETWPAFETRYFQARLMDILPKAELPFFTATDQSLVFQFDRGIWSDPELSGTVVARLYHDPKLNRLCLGIWPKPPLRTPSQILTLLENVETCEFKFYSPPIVNHNPVSPEEVGYPKPKEGWQETWSSEYNQLPALIKIKINGVNYRFDLPQPIYYGIS